MLLHPSALDKVVRAPFKVAEPIVKYELIKMPDSTAIGFGYYVETSEVVPVTHKGKAD